MHDFVWSDDFSKVSKSFFYSFHTNKQDVCPFRGQKTNKRTVSAYETLFTYASSMLGWKILFMNPVKKNK